MNLIAKVKDYVDYFFSKDGSEIVDVDLLSIDSKTVIYCRAEQLDQLMDSLLEVS